MLYLSDMIVCVYCVFLSRFRDFSCLSFLFSPKNHESILRSSRNCQFTQVYVYIHSTHSNRHAPIVSSFSHLLQSPVLEFSIFVTIKSLAPTSVNLSMAMAMSLRSTMAWTANQPSSSSALTVGARRPGVILRAASRFERSTL